MATINDDEDLSSRLFIKRKAYNVKLSRGVLSWCRCDSTLEDQGHSRHCHSLKLKRVLAVIPHVKAKFAEHPNDIELQTIHPVNNYSSFFLHIIVKKKSHKWINKSVHFNCGSTALGSKWITKIQHSLKEFDRPKRLLIFVNPHGGKKQAKKIFRNKVKPLFQLANIEMEVIETKRANHAKECILNEANLQQYDGIISVGGDGMFSEILNGVLLHGAQDRATSMPRTVFNPKKPSIKLGIIPAGSTDCVCYCTTGAIDPITSSLQIITGATQPMDISSIRSGDELLRYSVSFAGYGFFGDVVRDSEKLRWVGVKRYDLSGAKTFLANRYYEGELSYLISSDAQGHPQDKRKCRVGCSVCFPQTPVSFGDLVPAETAGWHNTTGRFISVIGATNCCANAKSPEGVSPSAHLADGCIDLVVVRHTSRVQYLRHMIRLAGRADHFDFNFVEVHRVKEFSFRPITFYESGEDEEFASSVTTKNPERNVSLTRKERAKEQEGQRKSVWNVDGEIIEEPSVHVRVHHQLITLFANGIEECERLTSCAVCRRR